MSWKRPALVIARWNFLRTTSNRSVSLSVTCIRSFTSEKLNPQTTRGPTGDSPGPRSVHWFSTRHRAVAPSLARRIISGQSEVKRGHSVERLRTGVQFVGRMRPFLFCVVLLAGCRHPGASNPAPVRAARDSVRVTRQPVAVRDTALEQRAARLELKVLEQDAQIGELQHRLDDARREVVRAMA